jgi:hypothetical protein
MFLLTEEEKLSIHNDSDHFTTKAIFNSSRQSLNKIIKFLRIIIEFLKVFIEYIQENPSKALVLLGTILLGACYFSTTVEILVLAVILKLLTELLTFKGICLITVSIVSWSLYKKLSEIAQALKKLE